MILMDYARRLKKEISLVKFKLENSGKEQFECPVCGYRGPFMDVAPLNVPRKHAQCPKCNAMERHRIQYLVVKKVLSNLNTSNQRMLHFAPEPFFKDYFKKQFGQYESADISMDGVDHYVDLQNLPFDDETYDFVFASHVLEHVPDDKKALSEICRILKPKGIAILPVPIVADKTVEYPEPNPHEVYHVRAPGRDYYDRYEQYFSKVETFSSDSLPAKYQLFIYEQRDQWPTEECPLRPSMPGEKHIDIVPVCYL